MPSRERLSVETDRLIEGVAGLIAGHAHGDPVAGATGTGPSGARSSLARSFATLEVWLDRRRRLQRARRVVFALAGCALVVGAGGFWARARIADGQPETITYTLNGGPPPPAGAVGPSTQAGEPRLSFSDGTRIEMTPQTHGRVVAVGRHGCRIALDDGKAQVQVAHHAGAQWMFEAGPFLINVHGTSFSFAWNARASRFELHMDSGVVSVTGPLSGGEIVLRAGESLSVGLHDREGSATVGGAELEPPPAERPPASTPGEPAAGLSRPVLRARAPQSWTTLLAEGHAGTVVADAERRGVGKILAERPIEDLVALADAARYQRNEDLARRALLTQRRRFPGSGRAAEASFFLGRLDDQSPRGAEKALSWYERYLNEAPGGDYVSEALGREMMVLERADRRSEAAGIAGDYLRRFPSGTYAHAAEALVRAP